MVRKTQKPAFESISADTASSIILATSGTIKGKEVDPRKQIGTIHIKKYLAAERINQQYENWIALLRKSIAAKEANEPVDYSAEEQAMFDSCKALTQEYLDSDSSDTLKENILKKQDELEQLKSIASSMKYKFSTYSFEVITHMINLMVRELLVFTCDSCLSKGGKLTKAAHMPWGELQTKMLSGLYMNTPLVYGAIHGVPAEETAETEAEVEEEVEEEVVDDSAEADATSVDGETVEETTTEDETKPKVKKFRPKLTQYITNVFKEINSREPRFQGLLLGKEVTAVVNDLVYQVMDRYVNVIKSLLKVANSKTITDHLAIIATVILLRDDIHTSEEDVKVIVDLIQDRIDSLKIVKKEKDVATQAAKDAAKATEETADAPVVPEATPAPTKGKKSAK